MRALGLRLRRFRGGIVFMLSSFGKKGQIAADETMKWIIYIAVLAAASFGVWKIAGNVFG